MCKYTLKYFFRQCKDFRKIEKVTKRRTCNFLALSVQTWQKTYHKQRRKKLARLVKFSKKLHRLVKFIEKSFPFSSLFYRRNKLLRFFSLPKVYFCSGAFIYCDKLHIFVFFAETNLATPLTDQKNFLVMVDIDVNVLHNNTILHDVTPIDQMTSRDMTTQDKMNKLFS